MILKYSKHLKQGKEFNVIFFVNTNFDNEILENFKTLFTRLSYDKEIEIKVTDFAKTFFSRFMW